MAKPKRSTDEVQREKLAKEDQKREAEEKRRQGIVNAAAIENRITQEDEARDKNTNHPPTADLKKILRPRQEKPATVDDNDSSLTRQAAVAAAPGVTIDPVSDGPGSSDEFELDKDNEENEDNDEDNEPVDTSEDEEAKPTKIARSKKPTKGSLRQAVDEERVKQGGRTSIREAPAKRKAPAEQVFIAYQHEFLLICGRPSSSKSSKKQKKAPIGGIRADWERGRKPVMHEFHATSRSRSTGSAMSIDRGGYDSSGIEFGPPGSDSSVMGGIPSDADDGEERAWAESSTDKAKEARAQATSFAGIIDTDAPGLVQLSSRRRTEPRIKKANITLSDLPEPLRRRFKAEFTPVLIEHAGTLNAWENPSTVDIIELWNSVFPEYKVDVATDHINVLVIAKLSESKLDSWRHKLAAAAIMALKIAFLADNITSHEDIADIVAFYLKGDDRNRVFYYREYAEDPETGEVNPKGIFQSFVISRVLAVHCNATTLKNSLGPTGFDACISSTRPTGALVLSIQAIKRALNYWKTGELVIPPAPLGNFSKSNWGDHVEFSEGVKKTVPSTSSLAVVVAKLDVRKWNKIIAAAREAVAIRDDVPAEMAIDVDAERVDDDFELLDNDSD
ncbi:hypothetical protein B0H10DRAFT_2195045 [Mycena sp. CBHHK59/15]|nr:hypothetical protein B0H10DRAFT_2195045 [Mycena sp. CBHHK59/15]